MLNRLLAFVIAAFWLTMTGMLLRSELNPGNALLRTVPLEHVMKVLLLNVEPSDLHISLEGTRVGFLRLQTRRQKEGGGHQMEFSGRFNPPTPGKNKQRMAWSGIIDLDASQSLEQLTFSMTSKEAELTRIELVVDIKKKAAQFRIKSGEEVVEEYTFSLDQTGAHQLLETAGIDPEMLNTFGMGNPKLPTVRAQQSTLSIRNESVETYLISMEQGGQTLVEAHLSSLGQILRVKTFLGYTLAPEDLDP